MFRSVSSTLLLVAALAATSFAQVPVCPFTSITTEAFGTAAGAGNDPNLAITFVSGSCGLKFAVSAFHSAPIAQIFILYGTEPLATPFALPSPPFVPGASLDIVPLNAIGPFSGASVTLPIPPNPALVGTTLVFEVIPKFALPPPNSAFGDTKGIKVKLL